jgi:hypothetical protein
MVIPLTVGYHDWTEADMTTFSRKGSALLTRVLLFIVLATFSVSAAAVPVQLENGTATFSQGPFGGGPYTPAQAIDGSFSPGNPRLGTGNGWAIDRFPGDFTTNETAVWQTVRDVGPSFLTFTGILSPKKSDRIARHS